MEKELEFIMDLMYDDFNINTLRKITEKIDREKNTEQIKEIRENDSSPNSAVFYLSKKYIDVNYRKLLNHAITYTSQIRNNYEITDEEFKLMEILTAYRIFLHEIHHSKQIYNVFDTNNMDPETEVLRSILNVGRKEYLKELKTKSREEIIEEKTTTINNAIRSYSELNPSERKAEIESLKHIKRIIEPLKNKYPKIYDEISFNEIIIKTEGYDEYAVGFEKNMAPFIMALRIIKQELHLPKIYLPYESSTYNEALEKLNRKTSEQEKLELGLNIKPRTLQKANDRMNALNNKAIEIEK